MTGSPALKAAIDRLKAKGYAVLGYAASGELALAANMEHPTTLLRATVSEKEIRFLYITNRLVQINILPCSPTSPSLDTVEATILEVIKPLTEMKL